MGALKPTNNWEKNGWNEKLRKWWIIDGLSASQIGAKLGVSRGAVLGKVHRNGWSGQRGRDAAIEHSKLRRKKDRRKTLARRAAETNNDTIWRLARGMEACPLGTYATAIRIVDGDTPQAERKHFLDLSTDSECCWPFDESNGTLTFCGRPSTGKSRYCCEHELRSRLPKVTS